eukprot:202508-Chlamydomonas_euryale.AAC.3
MVIHPPQSTIRAHTLPHILEQQPQTMVIYPPQGPPHTRTCASVVHRKGRTWFGGCLPYPRAFDLWKRLDPSTSAPSFSDHASDLARGARLPSRYLLRICPAATSVRRRTRGSIALR